MNPFFEKVDVADKSQNLLSNKPEKTLQIKLDIFENIFPSAIFIFEILRRVEVHFRFHAIDSVQQGDLTELITKDQNWYDRDETYFEKESDHKIETTRFFDDSQKTVTMATKCC